QGGGPLWTEHPTFSEYFDGDTGRGLGASHQTGWTALVAHLICSPDGRLHAPPQPPAAPPAPAAPPTSASPPVPPAPLPTKEN
ncbi:MAG: hypothetical protein ABI336_03475, partial [Humibacillus sp.]